MLGLGRRQGPQLMSADRGVFGRKRQHRGRATERLLCLWQRQRLVQLPHIWRDVLRDGQTWFGCILLVHDARQLDTAIRGRCNAPALLVAAPKLPAHLLEAL